MFNAVQVIQALNNRRQKKFSGNSDGGELGADKTLAAGFDPAVASKHRCRLVQPSNLAFERECPKF
jgi:hypothetical protein